jgi:hypothetical protein
VCNNQMTDIKTSRSEIMKAKGYYGVDVIGHRHDGSELIIVARNSKVSKNVGFQNRVKHDRMSYFNRMSNNVARLRAKLAAKNSGPKTDSNLAG